MDIVVQTEQKNKSGWHQNGQESPKRDARTQCWKMQTRQQQQSNRHQEGQENGNSAQARQWRFMQIPVWNGGRYPATPHRDIANAPGENERKQQRYPKNDQIEQGPRNSPRTKDKAATNLRPCCSKWLAE